MRLDPSDRSMTLGVGLTEIVATSAIRILSPEGVSSGRFSMLVTLVRVSGALHTWTS